MLKYIQIHMSQSRRKNSHYCSHCHMTRSTHYHTTRNILRCKLNCNLNIRLMLMTQNN